MGTNPQTALLVTAREAARLLAICPRSLWSITSPRGALPVIRLGRAVRYDVRDLVSFAEAQKCTKSVS
jgi:hypothetical protein